MRRFASIELVQDISEVPLKFNVLKKGPSFIIDWYIKKFNPFIIEKRELIGAEGLTARMPVTAGQAREDPDYFYEMAERTLISLRDYGVEIVLPPVAAGRLNFPGDILRIADGRNIFPFFVMRVVLKALKMLKKDVRTAEFVILDGNRDLSMSLIDNIYPHVNYLTVMPEDSEDEEYSVKAMEIFDDCGLNVQVTGFNKSLLMNADIIINTREDNHRYDYYYKRGAVYIDLSRRKSAELCSKREDMLIIDNLRVRLGVNDAAAPHSGAEADEPDITQFAPVMTLDALECAFYILSREYRGMLNRGYVSGQMEAAADGLARLSPEIVSLCLHGGVLSSASLTKILQKAARL